jgi:hypothetical protein
MCNLSIPFRPMHRSAGTKANTVMVDSGKNKIKNRVTEIERARKIAATLGVYTAAKYLNNRGWSLEAAQYILLGK